MNTKKYTLTMLIILFFVLLSLPYPRFTTEESFLVIPMSIIYIFLILILLLSLALLIIKWKNPALFEKIKPIFFEPEEKFDGEKYVEELRNKIVQVDSSKKDTKQKDIMELMFENMKEIKDYYIISKKQATNSFNLAVSLCIIGFICIIASIVLIIVFKKSVIESIIPGIAGAISEFVAGTALLVYKTSLEQLHNYYESLHNNERFLSLVNLVSKVSDKNQDQAYLNIISTELQNYRKQ